MFKIAVETFFLFNCVTAFSRPGGISTRFATSLNKADQTISSVIVPTTSVNVCQTPESLAKFLCRDFVECAKKEIASKGSFFVAVPGGSVLKMLSGLKSISSEVDWNKVFLFYVNHKCVTSIDPSATHFKAKSLFIDAVGIPASNVITLAEDAEIETRGHDTEANLYEKKIHDLVPQYYGLPVFDYMLLGMGKDGHIGSLYADRREVTMTDRWVLPVDKKTPCSITLSLPVMNAAKNIRVVLNGADKADAVYSGVYKTKTPSQFPVCGINNANWMIDEPAAAALRRARYEHCMYNIPTQLSCENASVITMLHDDNSWAKTRYNYYSLATTITVDCSEFNL
eukprot:gene6046-12190_t